MRIDLQIHSDALPHHSSWRPSTLITAVRIAGLAVFAMMALVLLWRPTGLFSRA